MSGAAGDSGAARRRGKAARPNDEIEHALARSVLAMDGSRRVGWAKHFESSGKLDDALRELNLATESRDHYRRALSWLAGATEMFVRYAQARASGALIAELTGSFDVLLDGQERARGQQSAAALWQTHKPQAVAEAERLKADSRKRRGKEIDRSWNDMKARAMKSIASAAGCRDVDELVERIAELQAAAFRRETENRRAAP